MNFFLSLATIFLLTSVSAYAENTDFNIETYKKLCGGNAYPACDGEEHGIDQVEIFEKARQAAVSSNRPLMLIVGGDWCGSCVYFDRVVKQSPLKSDLESRYVYVKIAENTKSGRQLIQQLGLLLIGYPSGFIFRSNGSDLALTDRFMPTSFIGSGIEDLINTFHKNPMAEKFEQFAESETTPIFKFKPDESTPSLSALLKPIGIVSTYGNDAFIIDSSELAPLINQGFAALNLFQYVDAIRSFNELLLADSNNTWGLIGLYFAIESQFISPAAETRTSILETLLSQKAKGQTTGTMNDWIDLVHLIEIASSDSYQFTGNEPTVSFFELHQRIIQNPSATVSQKALFIWNIIGPLSQALEPEGLLQLFEELTLQEPLNAASLHYMIHIAESLNNISKAKEIAQRLADLPIQSAHAVHMYGHTLPQFGEWEKARDMFLRADEIHHEWARKNGFSVFDDWHYRHNLELLGATLFALGLIEEAVKNWTEAFATTKISLLVAGLDDRKMASDIFKSTFEHTDQNADWFKQSFLPYLNESQLTNRSQALAHVFSDQDEYWGFPIDLVNSLKAVDPENQKAQDEAAQEIIKFIQEELQSGGFDGWSTSYLNLIRAKRFARLLGLNSAYDRMDAFALATRFSANCGSKKGEIGLMPCVKLERTE